MCNIDAYGRQRRSTEYQGFSAKEMQGFSSNLRRHHYHRCILAHIDEVVFQSCGNEIAKAGCCTPSGEASNTTTPLEEVRLHFSHNPYRPTSVDCTPSNQIARNGKKTERSHMLLWNLKDLCKADTRE